MCTIALTVGSPSFVAGVESGFGRSAYLLLVDPDTLAWVGDQFERREHPEQAYKVCLGLLNLSKQYPAIRLNAACRIANQAGLVRLKQVKAILKSNRDQLPEQLSLAAELPQDHENVRGPHNFH